MLPTSTFLPELVEAINQRALWNSVEEGLKTASPTKSGPILLANSNMVVIMPRSLGGKVDSVKQRVVFGLAIGW